MKKAVIALLTMLCAFGFLVSCEAEPEIQVQYVTVTDTVYTTVTEYVPEKKPVADLYTAGGFLYVKFNEPQEVNSVKVEYTEEERELTLEEVRDIFKPVFNLSPSDLDVLTSWTDLVNTLLDQYKVGEVVTKNVIMTDYSVAKYPYVRSNDVLESVFGLLGNSLFTLVAADETNTVFRLALALPLGVQNFADTLLSALLSEEMLAELELPLPIDLSGLTEFEGGLPIPPIYITTDILGVLGDIGNILNPIFRSDVLNGPYTYSSLLSSFTVYDADGTALDTKDFGRVDLSDLKYTVSIKEDPDWSGFFTSGSDKFDYTLDIENLDEDIQYTMFNIDNFCMYTFTGKTSISMELDDSPVLIILAKDPSLYEAKTEESEGNLPKMSSVFLYIPDYEGFEDSYENEEEIRTALYSLKPQFAKAYYTTDTNEHWQFDFSDSVEGVGLSVTKMSVKNLVADKDVDQIGYAIGGVNASNMKPCFVNGVTVAFEDSPVIGWGVSFDDLLTNTDLELELEPGFVRAQLVKATTDSDGKFVATSEVVASYNPANPQPAIKMLNEGGNSLITTGTYFVNVEVDIVNESGTEIINTLKRSFLVTINGFAN